MSRKPKSVLPATIYSPNSSHDDFVGDEKASVPIISYITYEEYRQNLESMCAQDKNIMGFLKRFCDEQSNGATPEELLSASISKQRAYSDLYDA